jgi:ubiquinone/menaquinone biosynthesis C-methylase UbiE
MSKNNKYIAKDAYKHKNAATVYLQRDYFKGILGKYRMRKEAAAVKNATSFFKPDSLIIDCPCGIGRWNEILKMNNRTVISMDVSEVMIRFAQKDLNQANASFLIGDAEHFPFQSNSVDHIFCFALFKHLPSFLQFSLLQEFKRVAKDSFVVSISLINVFNFPRMFFRKKSGPNSLLPYQFEKMIDYLDLEIFQNFNCSTAFGFERLLVIRKKKMT